MRAKIILPRIFAFIAKDYANTIYSVGFISNSHKNIVYLQRNMYI